MSGPGWMIAVPAAVGAAASFGAAGLLQHHATQEVPPQQPLRVKLILDLLAIRGFRYGVFFAALGAGLQVVALHSAPLAVVQPLLVTGVLFYLGYAVVFLHRPLDVGLVFGAVLALGGLVGFLLISSPTVGPDNITGAAVIPLAIGLAVVVAVSIWVAARLSHRLRAIPLAVATAVFYGATAGLVRSLVTSTHLALPDLFGHWQLYAVMVIGPLGFLLNQNAFQEGVLGSVSLAIIDVGDPLVSIGLGIAWFGDKLTVGADPIIEEVLLLAVMAGGILLLSRRAQQVADTLSASSVPTGSVRPGSSVESTEER